MAELIPLEYRIKIARARLIRRWSMLVGATALVAAFWLGQTYMWRRTQAADYAGVAQKYQEKSIALQQYNQLHERRANLSARMKNIQDIQGDKVLLSLLANVSTAFGAKDTLEFLQIEAHPVEKKTEEGRYRVRIHGITANDTTHSQLLERLTQIGRNAAFPIVVPLGEKHVSTFLDGEVTTFDITCDQPLAKGN